MNIPIPEGAADDMLSTGPAARVLGISPETLKGWREKNIGPPSYRAGPKKVVYPLSGLLQFLEKGRLPTNGKAPEPPTRRPPGLMAVESFRPILTDAHWAAVKAVLPARYTREYGEANTRTFIDRLLCLAEKSRTWSSMPPSIGHAAHNVNRMRGWTRAGLWPRIFDAIDKVDPLFQFELHQPQIVRSRFMEYGHRQHGIAVSPTTPPPGSPARPVKRLPGGRLPSGPMVAEARARRAAGESIRSIARALSIDAMTVHRWLDL